MKRVGFLKGIVRRGRREGRRRLTWFMNNVEMY